jgi:hypothetical protein
MRDVVRDVMRKISAKEVFAAQLVSLNESNEFGRWESVPKRSTISNSLGRLKISAPSRRNCV